MPDAVSIVLWVMASPWCWLFAIHRLVLTRIWKILSPSLFGGYADPILPIFTAVFIFVAATTIVSVRLSLTYLGCPLPLRDILSRFLTANSLQQYVPANHKHNIYVHVLCWGDNAVCGQLVCDGNIVSASYCSFVWSMLRLVLWVPGSELLGQTLQNFLTELQQFSDYCLQPSTPWRVPQSVQGLSCFQLFEVNGSLVQANLPKIDKSVNVDWYLLLMLA